MLPPATLASAVCLVTCTYVSSLGSQASRCQVNMLRPYLGSHLQPLGCGVILRELSGRPT